MSPFLWTAAALCAATYLILTTRPVSVTRSVVKTAAVACLAGVTAQNGPWLLVAALGFCALGDWLLSREGETAFMAGVGAFAIGHVAYAALFLTTPAGVVPRLFEAPQIWIVGALILLGLVMGGVLYRHAGPMRGPVMGYIPVILGMGIAALVLPPVGAFAAVLPAALAFMLSDLLLALELFVVSPHHPARRVMPFAVWILYWAAQASFAAAFT